MHHVIVIKGAVYVKALSRRNQLWQEVVTTTAALNKIAENENKLDINKVEAAKEIYLELRLKLRELGVW